MGLYDTYGSVQIKAGPCEFRVYQINDPVPIRNGVYVGYEGVVVISGGKLVAEYRRLHDKWGGLLALDEVLEGRGPLKKVLRRIGQAKETSR